MSYSQFYQFQPPYGHVQPLNSSWPVSDSHPPTIPSPHRPLFGNPNGSDRPANNQVDDRNFSSNQSNDNSSSSSLSGANPKFGYRGFFEGFKALVAKNGEKSNRTWLDSGANSTFVWDRSVMISYTTVTDSFAEIFQGSSRISGHGKFKVEIGSKTSLIVAKHTPNFSENIVAFSSITPFFRVIFENFDVKDAYFLQDRSTGEEIMKKLSSSGLYPFPNPVSEKVKYPFSSSRFCGRTTLA